MGEQLQEHRLSEILKAASDGTRRSILTTLVQEGPLRVTELAERATHLMVRPEHVQIVDATSEGDNLIAGEIESVMFCGKSVEYAIRTECAQSFSVCAPSSHIRAAGEKVRLRLPAENCVLLADPEHA